MALERPDTGPLRKPRPLDEPPGPSGVAATALLVGGLVVVGLIVIALGLIGGWVGFAIAIVLMIFGVLSLSRRVERLTRTGSSEGGSRRGSVPIDGGSSITEHPDESPSVSVRDTPLDSRPHRHAARRPSEKDRLLLAGQPKPKR